MKKLFDKTTINNLTIKNRLVRSATWEGMCEPDGRPTRKLFECYHDLAQGEIGLIITGYTFVRSEGKQLPGKMGIQTNDFAEEMKELTRTVHRCNGAICMQLVHAGGQTDSQTAGRQPFAPSAVTVEQYEERPEALSRQDIQEIVTAFAQGAARAKQYGFDAVQLHAAHGYLINQFLSPLTNKRSDEYGGSVEKRRRFLMEVYRSVRSAVGKDYPIMIKLNGSDFLKGGLTIDESLLAAQALDEEGIDAIEVSGGTPVSGKQSPARLKIERPEQEGYHRDLASKIREKVQCPIMIVGGFRSYEVAEQAFEKDEADYIAMSRPLIREPDLARRWRLGDTSPARCISCNGCFKPGLKEGGIYCVVSKKEQEQGR